MPPSIKELADKRNKLLADNRALLDATEKAGLRDLGADAQKEYDAREADIDQLDSELQSAELFETRKAKMLQREADSNKIIPRQTQTVGDPARRDPGDGETLSIDFGRAGMLELEPDHPARFRADPAYRKAVRDYLSYREPNFKSLGFQVGVDPKAGVLVPMATLSGLIKFLDDNVVMRSLATVLQPTNAKSVGMLSYDTDYADADWTAEIPASDLSEDSAAAFGNREMTPHLLTKLVKASEKILESQTAIGIEAFISQRLGYKFAITENKAFLTGNGSQRPLGVFTASNDGVPTTRDVTASATSTPTTSFGADDLIDTEESLKDVYQRKAVWLGSRGFRQRCRKLKDGNGQYLLRPTGSEGGSAVNTLNEHPLYVDENAPSTFTTGLYIAAFFDPSFYYIQDGIDMRIQRINELFTLRNQVGWKARKETDGMPVLAEAFARLKLA